MPWTIDRKTVSVFLDLQLRRRLSAGGRHAYIYSGVVRRLHRVYVLFYTRIRTVLKGLLDGLIMAAVALANFAVVEYAWFSVGNFLL